MVLIMKGITITAMITNPHRYSGWPGAWCLDCGAPDPGEEALAHGCLEFKCRLCNEEWPVGECSAISGGGFIKSVLGSSHIIHEVTCEEGHGSQECFEPNSNRFNPYLKMET
jgi:hypothetical protein